MIRIPRPGDRMRLTEACGTCALEDDNEVIMLPVGTLLIVEQVFLYDHAQGFQIMVTPETPGGATIGQFFFLDQGDRPDGLITAEFAA